MKSRITKLAIAALVVIAVLVGVHYSGGSIDPSTIAWAAVTKRVAEVDLLHFYQIEVKGKDVKAVGEAWYAYGKLAGRNYTGETVYDDGVKGKSYSPDKTLVGYGPSIIAKGLFNALTLGSLSDDNEEFQQQVPASVGEDFLIYNFSPPGDWDEELETISVTVGRNSLLPVQVKLHYKGQDRLEGDHMLLVFDYEAPEKPAEFFEPPAASAPGEPPHGVGEVMLDGQEVMVDIHNAPGIATSAVRLHSKSSEYSGGPLFSLDVAFITVEGYRSATNASIRLGLNEATNCGVGGDWPDGKYRNIRFWPLLKPTEKEDTYIVEIRCWLRTEK